MNRISTHRILQLVSLQATIQSLISVHSRCASNLSRIGNVIGANHYNAILSREKLLEKRIDRRLAHS
jgi:hypothetical protein